MLQIKGKTIILLFLLDFCINHAIILKGYTRVFILQEREVANEH